MTFEDNTGREPNSETSRGYGVMEMHLFDENAREEEALCGAETSHNVRSVMRPRAGSTWLRTTASLPRRLQGRPVRIRRAGRGKYSPSICGRFLRLRSVRPGAEGHVCSPFCVSMEGRHDLRVPAPDGIQHVRDV